jgi:hypothetical protein
MSEPRRRWWGRRLEDLSPELFWLYLVLCWLLALGSLWSYARRGDSLSLLMIVLTLALGLQGLWVLRRRRSRPER